MTTATTTPAAILAALSNLTEPCSAIQLATLPSGQLIARYRKGVENFDRRLFKLSESQIDQAFLPNVGGAADVGRWPVRVLLGHLADADLAQSHRMRRAVGEDNPVLSSWDENAFIDNDVYGLNHALATDPAAQQHAVMNVLGGNVALIHTVRQWTGQWLSTLTEAQLGRTAMHPERGSLSVKLMLASMVWHLEHHARFLARKLDRLVGPDVEDEAPKGGCGAGCGCKSK